MIAEVFDDRICKLGEGPLWHPKRQQLFWFDILGKKLLSRTGNDLLEWQFSEYVSAAGWIDRDALLLASDSALWRFNLNTGEKRRLHTLESTNLITRSNDGRADRWGGFWIGTMGKHAEPGAGAIYRFWRGELRELVSNVTVSNAICFDPQKPLAYYTDTVTQLVMAVPLDPGTGWPSGPAQVHLDLTTENRNPDGAVTDTSGDLWIAEWGSAGVSRYDVTGSRLTHVAAGASQTSCPAWGGSDFRDLYITSASVGLSAAHISEHPNTGKTFVGKNAGAGQPEPCVIL